MISVTTIKPTDPEVTTHRVAALDNGNKLHITCRNPYGFWYIHYDKGQIPESLKGQYTSFQEAEKAVNLYLAEKSKEKNV